MLNWPEEVVGRDENIPAWSQAGSNCCLDFHGDPLKAELVVFSDGNHHMALLESLELFRKKNAALKGVFYATTPPGPVLQLLSKGGLRMGNLVLSIRPHLFLCPPAVLDRLVGEGDMGRHLPFMRNRGSVLLIKKGNPKKIKSIADLARPGVRLFLSNPETEKVSYQGYVESLQAMAARQGVDLAFLEGPLAADKIVYGECIHHREAPQAVADGRADAAMVYYHLGLRYCRIFADRFAIIPLGGTAEDPQPEPGNVISRTHVGLIGDGGVWGKEALEFLQSAEVAEIYRSHGLLPCVQG